MTDRDRVTIRYDEIRRATENLARPLSPEDCTVQSMRDASPVKWHLAHTSWFFETFILEAAVPGYRPFHPAFRVLFNSYYNAVGEQHPRPRRGLLTRPTLEEVYAYRSHVDRWMREVLADAALAGGALGDAIELGLQHEQQHQELILTDVKHLLSCNPLRPAYRPASYAGRGEGVPADRDGGAPAQIPALGWRSFDEGLREIGRAGAGFAYDNEGPRHKTFVHAFEIASRLITCGEYLQFIDDGGYERPELWLSDGWAAAQAGGWGAPLYWEERDGRRLILTLAGLRELDAAEPVAHVSFYEADAFARWAGARLPDEAEWETAALGMAIVGNFVESGLLHPSLLLEASSDRMPAQLYGDVWEWSRSAYGPYPGYRPPEGALGEYNGKFMSGQMVLRGGSCASPRSHIRPTYRNFFPPEARWQFSGIRLARDLS